LAIDRPTKGELLVLGENVFRFNDKQSAHWRNAHIGYVCQTFNLIPVLTAFENVELPLLLTKLNAEQRRDHVMTALKLVGLEDRADHLPKQLSGGQEQRVAIARAIVSDPTLLLADEPTGDLDSHSATEILEILKRLNEDFRKTIVMVTHDPHAASYAHVTRHLEKACYCQGNHRLSVSQQNLRLCQRNARKPLQLSNGAYDQGMDNKYISERVSSIRQEIEELRN